VSRASRRPYQRPSFEAAREVLADILDEAASCAADAGEMTEAKLLKKTQAQLATALFSSPREIGFDVGRYRYWIMPPGNRDLPLAPE
jgi:hypothetical protein